jgi:hypothetical protein
VPATTADSAGEGAAEVERDGVGPLPGPAGPVLAAAVPVRSTLGTGEVAPAPAPPAPGEAAGDDPVVAAGALLPGSTGKEPGRGAPG